MHLRNDLADFTAMVCGGSPWPHAFQKGDQGRWATGQFTQCMPLAVVHRQRTGHALFCQMLHQTKKERQIIAVNAFFVERQNIGALACVQQKVGILNTLGNTLVRGQFTYVIGGQERAEFRFGYVGIDRQWDAFQIERVASS